jgi:tubulin beta
MGTEFQEVLCDEHGIGGDGECFGGNDAQLDRINVLYNEAPSGKYKPRAVFFDKEPGMISAVRASPLGELFRLGNLVNHTRGQNGPKATKEGFITVLLTLTTTKAPSTNSSHPPR